jgi:ureidoglycolate lyase
MHAVQTASGLTRRDLVVKPLTAEAFAPFGHVIAPTEDGAPVDLVDQALDLSHGRPRFYIMDLTNRGVDIVRITRHRAVTQVLASADAQPWMLAVAPPSDRDRADAAPAIEEIRGFLIPGGVAVMLERGTWHAGPHFSAAKMAFFNLELADTNVVDHHTVELGVVLHLADPGAVAIAASA